MMWKKRNSSSARAPRARGDTARDAGDWPVAAAAYLEHVAASPNDFGIWVQLGHARKECGDLDGAAEAYLKAERLQPDDSDLLLNFGRLRRMQGRQDEAMVLIRRSFEIDANPHAANELKIATGQQRLHVSNDVEFDADRLKVLNSGFFDLQWYIERNRDVPPSYMTPLDHYMKFGAYEGRSPGPRFDGAWYLAQNPDLAIGANARTLNPLLHYLDFGAVEGRKPAPPPGILESAQKLLDSVIDLDPQIYSTEHFKHVKTLRIEDGLSKSKPYQVFKRVFGKLDRAYDYVVCIPWLVHGGADLVAMHLARAIVEAVGKHAVLVLACDHPRSDALDWLPQGADFAMLPDAGESLDLATRAEALLLLLQAIQPKKVVNINSHACWELLRSHGLALSNFTDLYAGAFCRDFTPDDRPAGYADTHLRDALPNLRGVILDNAAFADFLFDHFGLPSNLRSKMLVLRQPAPESTETPQPKLNGAAQTSLFPASTETPFKVFWASRFARQKNVKLLAKIAPLVPEIKFEVWGRGEPEYENLIAEAAHKYNNIVVMGPFDKFSLLPVGEYDAFLYTSLWDGIPNVLLEVAASDVPIIAAHVGGIGELVNASTGWLIDDHENPAAYARALRELKASTSEAKKRRLAMQALLRANHSWASYMGTLRASGFFGAEMS